MNEVFSKFKGMLETGNIREVLIAFLEKNPDYFQCAPVEIRRGSAADFLNGENPEDRHRLSILWGMVELLKECRKSEYSRFIEAGAKYVGISYKNGEISFKDEEELYFADFDKLAVIGAYLEKFVQPEMNDILNKYNEAERKLLLMTLKSMDSDDFLHLCIASFKND